MPQTQQMPQPLQESEAVAQALQPLPALKAADSLPHKSYTRAQLVLMAGRREFGKTTALRRYISTAEPRLFALDPFKDFPDIMQCHSVQEGFDDLERFDVCRRRFIPNINVGSRDFGNAFFERCFDSDRGLRDCLLCMDEITLWSDSREAENLEKLILQGRRIGIRIVTACQRIALVPDVMKSEITEMLIFRTTRPRDLDVIREWAGESYADLAPKLKIGECLRLTL